MTCGVAGVDKSRIMQSACREYRPWLAPCVEANMRGEPLDNWKAVDAHLRTCLDCVLEYCWLLHLSLLEEDVELSMPTHAPRLDTAFLRRSSHSK